MWKLLLPLVLAGVAQADTREVRSFSGVADASAAEALDNRFLVVAGDEDNNLRVYDWTKPGAPVSSPEWNRLLPRDLQGLESDIEGGARLDDLLVWIGSHGRNKKGVHQPARCVLFATALQANEGGRPPSLRPAGHPCRSLLSALATHPPLKPLGVAEAIGIGPNGDPVPANASLAPKENGLNIEGLATGPDGRSLLIGFRHPIPGGRALVVPLTNASEVIRQGAAPHLGEPIRLDLGGLGIRGLERNDKTGEYYIVAGPGPGGGGAFQVFRWSGRTEDPPALLAIPTPQPDLTPESILEWPDGRWMLISDDGDRPGRDADGKIRKMKNLEDASRRAFRAWTVEIP